MSPPSDCVLISVFPLNERGLRVKRNAARVWLGRQIRFHSFRRLPHPRFASGRVRHSGPHSAPPMGILSAAPVTTPPFRRPDCNFPVLDKWHKSPAYGRGRSYCSVPNTRPRDHKLDMLLRLARGFGEESSGKTTSRADTLRNSPQTRQRCKTPKSRANALFWTSESLHPRPMLRSRGRAPPLSQALSRRATKLPRYRPSPAAIILRGVFYYVPFALDECGRIGVYASTRW